MRVYMRAIACACQGVLAGLDRRFFEVHILCVVNANMFLAEEVLAAADVVHHLPLNRQESARVCRRNM